MSHSQHWSLGGAFGQFGGTPPLVPNDPFYAAGNPVFPQGQHWIGTTRVDVAWALVGYDDPFFVSTDPNRTIAIIDTGIDPDHVEFETSPALGVKVHPQSRTIVEGAAGPGSPWCGCDPDDVPQAFIEDTYWGGTPGIIPHGTVSSGLTVARENNTEGIAGVCWDCTALVLVITTEIQGGCPPENPGVGVRCNHTDANTAKAILYAAGADPATWTFPSSEVRARVISLATESRYLPEEWCNPDNPLYNAVKEATDRGCVIVATSGNDNLPGNNPPITAGLAIHPGTITVGGCDEGGQWVHSISQTNPVCAGLCDPECAAMYPGLGTHVDPYDGLTYSRALSVVAPIEDMFSTWYMHEDNNYEEYGSLAAAPGTSWAAPQVAGMAALMLRVNPDLTPAQVKYIIEATATDLTTEGGLYPGYDRFTGYGLVNAENAVIFAMKLEQPGDWNGDGNVETLDAGQYTIDYTNADAMTDLNLDTTQSADDMAIFLDSYAGD